MHYLSQKTWNLPSTLPLSCFCDEDVGHRFYAGQSNQSIPNFHGRFPTNHSGKEGVASSNCTLKKQLTGTDPGLSLTGAIQREICGILLFIFTKCLKTTKN